MSQPSWPPPLLIPLPPPQPSYLSQDSLLPSTWWGRGCVLVCLALLALLITGEHMGLEGR